MAERRGGKIVQLSGVCRARHDGVIRGESAVLESAAPGCP
jgi:hypothetical protein